MVRFALDSIAAQTYRNFEVAIIDDSAFGDQIEDVLWGYEGQLNVPKIYEVGDDLYDKRSNGGSRHGQFVNMAIKNSDADIGLMLCDDDALMPSTLEQLNEYYTTHPNVQYSYGHVLTYNPYEAKNYASISGRYGSQLNSYNEPINAYCRVDASQVSWRMDSYKNSGISFPSPQTSALDAIVYQQMYDVMGPCEFNGKFVQYKGVFSDQLGSREDPFKIVDKATYDS